MTRTCASSTRSSRKRISKATAIIRCWRPAITRASRWPGCSARLGRQQHRRRSPAAARRPIAALPPAYRRKLMVTCDGAGASHELVEHLDKLAPGAGTRSSTRSGGSWAPASRPPSARSRSRPGRPRSTAARSASGVPSRPAQPACGHRACWIEEAHVTELTGLLREGPAGDQLKAWPEDDAGLRPPRAARTPARNCPCSRQRTAGVTRCGSQPAPLTPEAGAARAPTSTPPTGSTPGSRTSSAPARTPASDSTPPATTRSTRRG